MVLGLALILAGCDRASRTGSRPGGTSPHPPTLNDAGILVFPDGGVVPDGGQGDAVDAGADAGMLGSDADAGSLDSGSPDAGPDDAGTPDAGTQDAGVPDAGMQDAGTQDAGVPDAGTVTFPTSVGWTFYGPQQGVPNQVLGVTADEGGNVWVAGGEDGLFLLTPGGAAFQRYTLADGLHPYGFMPDGTDAPGPHYLNVLSVSGGPAGTVFVGYQGRSTAGNLYECEDNWDRGSPDPSIYKSGDADRVTLTGTALSVVHYDIFSGPGQVAAEPRGRERLCNIWRVRYDGRTQSVWFGGNHGFAWGDPTFPGITATGCTGANYGKYTCSGVFEHAHPAFPGYTCDTLSQCPTEATLTDGYYGIASVGDGDMWIGGVNRSLHFNFGSRGINFFTYEVQQFNIAGQLDLWPDAAKQDTTPSQRKDDLVSGIAVTGDGTAWVSSFVWGVAHLAADGSVGQYLTASDGLVTTQSYSIAADPSDGSIWVGAGAGGLTRIQGSHLTPWSLAVLGTSVTAGPVSDIQMDTSVTPRRMVVGFKGIPGTPGAVGIYVGP